MDTEFRTTMMVLMSREDAGKIATLVLPCACMGRCIAGLVADDIHKQGKRNMEKNPELYKVGDMVEITKEFKKEFKGEFHGGDKPDSVDITFYGYLTPGL